MRHRLAGSTMFTPAALRALRAAARRQPHEPRTGSLELLLGVLEEPECRGAVMLASRGVTAEAVTRRWPICECAANGSPVERPLSDTMEQALAALPRLLAHHPQPLSIGTEHLLLALLSVHDEVAAWLEGHGFAAADLIHEIDGIYGYFADTSPLPMDEEAIPQRPISNALAVADRGTAIAADPPQLGRAKASAAVLRVLDAAANRAREGLRVAEDFARFVLGDKFLTKELKQLRHEVRAALSSIGSERLLACRDTPGDVGTQVATASEGVRTDSQAVAAAALKRVQESFRSLEEFGKTVDAAMAARLEQMRYRSYTLERAVLNTAAARDRLATVRLYVLLDGCGSEAAFSRMVNGLIESGVDAIQLRDKALDDRTLLARARVLQSLVRAARAAGRSVLFIVNDRPDLAVLAQADGVHVGQEEISVCDARRIVGPDLLIGVSTHSIEQARQAMLDGADYIGVGPMFASSTKQFEQLAGLAYARQVAAELSLPAFAIGGITLENLNQVLGTGIGRAAVSGAILRADDPLAAAREFARRMKGGSATE